MTISDYNRLVDSNSDKLLRYALKLTGEYHWAQDLVQDSYLKLWVHRVKITIEHANPFLYKVLYNKMVDDKRKTQRTQLMENLPEQQRSGRGGSGTGLESKDLLDKAFRQLTDQQKQIILLRDWEGYSYKEIGGILEANESQVKVQLFRARKKMKQVVTSLNNDYSKCDENK